MLSKKFIILLVLIIFFFIPIIKADFLSGNVDMNATISSSEYGEILIIDYNPTEIHPNDAVNITINFTNKGNSNGDFKIILNISKDEENFYNNSCNFSLDVSEIGSCSFIYIPNQIGTYLLLAQIKNQTETYLWDSKSDIMIVSSVTTTTAASGLGGGGGPAGPTGPTTSVIKKIEIVEYPSEINGTRGETKMVLIKVNNTGNVDLEDVVLNVENLPFYTEITPERMNISVNQIKNFLLRIEIPYTAEFRDYIFDIKVETDQVSDDKEIVLTILDKSLKERIKSEILGLDKIIIDLWEETINLEKEGHNVSQVFDILDNARENLKRSESYYEQKDFDNSEEHLENARQDLEKTATEISKIKIKPLILPALPFKEQIKIIIFIVSIIGLIVFLILRKRRTYIGGIFDFLDSRF